MTANDAIRNYRVILLGRLNNTKNEIEYYKKNLKNTREPQPEPPPEQPGCRDAVSPR